MFGLGIWEIAIILIVALMVLGPEKLPGVARQVGRVARELRRAASEFQNTLANADFDGANKPPQNPPVTRVKPAEGAVAQGAAPSPPPAEVVQADGVPGPDSSDSSDTPESPES